MKKRAGPQVIRPMRGFAVFEGVEESAYKKKLDEEGGIAVWLLRSTLINLMFYGIALGKMPGIPDYSKPALMLVMTSPSLFFLIGYFVYQRVNQQQASGFVVSLLATVQLQTWSILASMEVLPLTFSRHALYNGFGTPGYKGNSSTTLRVERESLTRATD